MENVDTRRRVCRTQIHTPSSSSRVPQTRCACVCHFVRFNEPCAFFKCARLRMCVCKPEHILFSFICKQRVGEMCIYNAYFICGMVGGPNSRALSVFSSYLLRWLRFNGPQRRCLVRIRCYCCCCWRRWCAAGGRSRKSSHWGEWCVITSCRMLLGCASVRATLCRRIAGASYKSNTMRDA